MSTNVAKLFPSSSTKRCRWVNWSSSRSAYEPHHSNIVVPPTRSHRRIGARIRVSLPQLLQHPQHLPVHLRPRTPLPTERRVVPQ
jgi:hypothetical protein